MKVINTYRSGTGSTVHSHTFYGKIFQTPHIKSYAALILLQNYLYVRDKDYLEDNFMVRINFSRDYLSDQLKQHGKLTCKYCSKTDLQIEYSDMHVSKANKATIDHVIPLSKGGKFYDLNNIVIACSKCNCSKGNLMPDEFMRILAKKQQKLKLLLPIIV